MPITKEDILKFYTVIQHMQYEGFDIEIFYTGSNPRSRTCFKDITDFFKMMDKIKTIDKL